MLGSILGAAGSVLGTLGAGKNKGASEQTISGYQSLPKEIREYLLQDLFPDMQGYRNKPYEGLPMRRINESDLDPVFGSKARQDLQAWRDWKLASTPIAETPQVAPQQSNAEMMKAYALMGGGANAPVGQKMNDIYSRFINDTGSMEAIADILKKNPQWKAQDFTTTAAGDLINRFKQDKESSAKKPVEKSTQPFDWRVIA